MIAPEASIITIGDELLIGQTIDTNSAFIAQQLNRIGFWVKRRVAVGDLREEILTSLEQELKVAELVIITGGLGPTADDITKPALCSFFNSELRLDEGVLKNVTEIFDRFNRPVTEVNRKQAMVPHNCVVLHNARGTAPGMWFQREDKIVISLPGVPFEMKGIFMEEIIPRLPQNFKLPFIIHRTLHTAGIGESMLAEHIKDFEAALPSHIKLAYLPSFGQVKLRLTTKGWDAEILKMEITEQVARLKERVQQYLVSAEDQPLEETIRKLLLERELTVSTAESCTGGYIAHMITSRAGSSKVFEGSVIAYSNDLKSELLQVDPLLIKEHGAVSQQVVEAMCRGSLEATGSHFALATSGIMGPDGGTREKPVGSVWIAVGSKKGVKSFHHNFRFDRQKNIEVAGQTALLHLRKSILEDYPSALKRNEGGN